MTPSLDYFKPIPQEIAIKIFGTYHSSGPIKPYLSAIACISKVWNARIHDVIVHLLNRGMMNLTEVPFLAKASSNLERSCLHTYKYLKFLQGDVSLEELQSLDRHEKETFQSRSLTLLNLKEISHLDVLEMQELGSLFSKIQKLLQPCCTYKDDAILSKFTRVRHLGIAPNEHTDLSFIKNLSQLHTLCISCVTPKIFQKSLIAVMDCPSISELKLTNILALSIRFPKNYQLPDQLKVVTLNNLEIDAHIFSFSSHIEHIHLLNLSILNPDAFKHLQNLKRLSIHCGSRMKALRLQELKLESIRIQSEYLRELHLNKVVCNTVISECPKLWKTTTINNVMEKFDPFSISQ